MNEIISVADIDENALTVLRKLRRAGYQAYFVGGCVRDLLLKRLPKDFDIATDAKPHEIKDLFHNCRLIGRRFRLAHIFFDRQIIEVATFRGPHQNDEESSGNVHENGLILRDNVYGTLEEDAWRRDFTINALYYDPDAEEVIDIVNGMADLRKQVLRIIGDPLQRYREDPVRMLRAIRFASKLKFSLEEKTAKAILACKDTLSLVSTARLFDEVVKLCHSGNAVGVFELLQHYQISEKLFPLTQAVLQADPENKQRAFLQLTLKNTDARIQQGKTVTPAFLFAVMLWYPLQNFLLSLQEQAIDLTAAFEMAADAILTEQRKYTVIPHYLIYTIREIWLLQQRLLCLQEGRPQRLLSHPRFRAGYDFLLLRSEIGEVDKKIVTWWTTFQEADAAQQEKMLTALGKQSKSRRRRRTKKKE